MSVCGVFVFSHLPYFEAGFSAPIASHMNADHEDSLLVMVKHYVGLTVEKAAIASLDALGRAVYSQDIHAALSLNSYILSATTS